MSAQIMAIINTSPDSFSGDGIAAADEDALLSRLRIALDEGADILDIGGQSTRPGAEIIGIEEEIARVLPAIKLARQLDKTIPISVDTFKPAVAVAALEAGATMLNDITGFSDQGMLRLAVETDGDIVAMHMRGTPRTMSRLTDYPLGIVTEVKQYFAALTKKLQAAGVSPERIIIDPGIGFAKTAEQSFELTNHLAELKSLGFRVLYGASNKSFLGKALAHDGQAAPVEERAAATVAVQTNALLQGADIVRVHDVRSAVQTRIIVEAMQGRREVMP